MVAKKEIRAAERDAEDAASAKIPSVE